MSRTRRKKKNILKNPVLWSVAGAILAMGLILLCVFLFMDAADSSRLQARKVEPTENTRQPYSPEDFVLNSDGFMECVGDIAYSTGIDVSFYQGDIDWEKVKADGVEFVFIRIGGRDGSDGSLYTDSMAQNYYEDAKAAGLEIGAYFFSQAITEEEAREEAEFVLRQVKGWELTRPIVFDWEYINQNARTANMNKALLTQCTLAFCEVIEEAGEAPMIYFNESQGKDLLDLDALRQYPFWLAMYGGELDVPYRVDYWQYSETGNVDGIDHNVDLNIYLP